MHIDVIKKHTMLSLCNEMAPITTPLKKHLGITVFTYHKLYRNGSMVHLDDNIPWVINYYNKGYYNDFWKRRYQSGYSLWPMSSEALLLSDACINFNIANGITFINQQMSFIEFFSFGSTPHNAKIIDFYINNLPLLEKFITYFKHQAKPLLKEAEKNRIFLPQKSDTLPFKHHASTLDEQSVKNYLSDIGAETPSIQQLTPRERSCANYLTLGKSVKEIAGMLEISPRTVEKFIEKLKIKMNVKKQSELIIKLLKEGL